MARNAHHVDVEGVSSYQLRDKLLPGASVPCHLGPSLDKPPEWLDREKFSRGQAFCRKYLGNIFLAHYFTSVFFFIWRPTFQVFLQHDKLDTLEKMWNRNTRLYRYISKWYEGDMWEAGSAANRTMKNVHFMHEKSFSKTEKMAEEVLAAQIDTTKEPQEWAKCNLWSAIRKDATFLMNQSEYPPLIPPENRCIFSQLDFALSIVGLISPIVYDPPKMGVHHASMEDLEGLLHLWRVIGYYLGLEDRFNPCDATLEDFHTLCKEFAYGVIISGMVNITREDEYSSQIAAKSLAKFPLLFFINFDIVLLLNGSIFGVRVENTRSAMSFRNKFFYGVVCIGMFSMRWMLVVKFANYFVRKYLGVKRKY